MSIQVQIPSPVAFIFEQLMSHGHQAYLVGGAARDLILGQDQITDWDFTTSATPQQVLELFSESFYDNNYGTVMVAPKHVCAQAQLAYEFPSLDVFDITTFRHENGYTNRRHPDEVVWGTSLEADVSRRDFTINAIALGSDALAIKAEAIDDLGYQPANLEVYDFHQGLQDINQGMVRTVGNPSERFGEDALRMMRAVRIATVLGFKIDQATAQAISAQAGLLQTISGERIRDELFKILSSSRPAEGIELLYQLQLLEHILPELTAGEGVAQGGRHHYDVWTHSLESLRHCPSKDPLVRLATLLHDIGKPAAAVAQGPRGVTFYGHEVVGAHLSKDIADRLRLSRDAKQKLFTLIRWHMFTYNPEMTDSAIRRFIRRVGLDNINDMISLRIGDRLGGGSRATSWRLRELQERIGENLYQPLSLKDLKINGHDLMTRLKVPPSRHLGLILNRLFEMVMEDQVPNEPEALSQAADKIHHQLLSSPDMSKYQTEESN